MFGFFFSFVFIIILFCFLHYFACVQYWTAVYFGHVNQMNNSAHKNMATTGEYFRKNIQHEGITKESEIIWGGKVFIVPDFAARNR